MPDHFQKIAAAAAEAEQVTAQRIAPQHLLHLQRADRSVPSYWWRGVERHFRPGDLPADQQRYKQRCSKQATSDHSEKTIVGFVVRHFPLLYDNSASPVCGTKNLVSVRFTRRHNCIRQLSPFSEYALGTGRFPVRKPATIKLTHYPPSLPACGRQPRANTAANRASARPLQATAPNRHRQPRKPQQRAGNDL
jgi:hypothetical protein